jgi:hypothetical protein
MVAYIIYNRFMTFENKFMTRFGLVLFIVFNAIFNNISWAFGLWDYRSFGLLGLPTIGPSDYLDFGILGPRTIRPSDYWTFGPSGRHRRKIFFSFFFPSQLNNVILLECRTL